MTRKTVSISSGIFDKTKRRTARPTGPPPYAT